MRGSAVMAYLLGVQNVLHAHLREPISGPVARCMEIVAHGPHP